MHDEFAIQQILNRYTDGCNRQDWDQVLATFAEDGIWDAMGAPMQGHVAIRAAMSGFLKQMDYFVQTSSAAVIEIAGDIARGRVSIRECGKFVGRDEAVEVLGYYEDYLVRTAEGWKFARRKFRSLGLHRFALIPGNPFG